MRGVIVTGGSLSDTGLIKEYVTEGSLVIACDSGLNHLHRAGVVPDIILGDFDSVNPDVLSYYRQQGAEITTYPVKKDSTDTELGIFAAQQQGCDEIIILGGSGTRLDHTLANIQIMLPLAKKGIKARLADANNVVELVTDRLEINNKMGSYISLLPLTEQVEGITTTGMEYPLNNATINVGSSLTVSNVITAQRAGVTVKKGVLIAITAKD